MPQMTVSEILEQLSASKEDVGRFLQVHRPEKELWEKDVRLYCEFARQLISFGQPVRAFELVREGLAIHNEPELIYLGALAMARGGNHGRAEQLATDFLHRRDLAPALKATGLSLMGRLRKDRLRRHTDEPRRLALEAADFYEQAHELTNDIYPAINAATLRRLAGDIDRSRELAAQIVPLAEQQLKDGEASEDHWVPATLAEAYLLLEEFELAEANYCLAVQRAGRRLGDLAVLRRQVQLLQKHLDIPESLLAVLRIGTVVVFSGHLIDRPDRIHQGGGVRFPSNPVLEENVRKEIRQHLTALDARVGYTSVACGADLLCAEEMLALGVELHVVLPFAQTDFFRVSVDFGLAEMQGWRQRAERVLKAAFKIHYATAEEYLGDDSLFDFANHVMQGLAVTRAIELETEAVALIVADLQTKPLEGGTLEFFESWNRTGRRALLIDLASLRGESSAPGPPRGLDEVHREIKSMLFADVKGFSRLREDQTPKFFQEFLKAVMDSLESSGTLPVFRNTWGDALFLVFENPVDCANLALRLRDRISEIHFEDLGLPGDIGVRIALHSGPVYRHEDPVIGRPNFVGSHVNRTARIEPVTMPGCVYASEQMASLLALHGENQFACEYVGVEDLAKGYDRCPLYHVSPR